MADSNETPHREIGFGPLLGFIKEDVNKKEKLLIQGGKICLKIRT